MRGLVVDDNALVAEATAATLGAGGHRADVVGSAEAALERYRPGLWDIVLTDLKLPGIDGWALLARLRELEPALPVAILPGRLPAAGEPEGLARGACWVLMKPADPAELLAAIERVGPPAAR